MKTDRRVHPQSLVHDTNLQCSWSEAVLTTAKVDSRFDEGQCRKIGERL